ncbi:hypothetical protein HY623_00610, partial [Candidatus Uhrbacteria bacterium]|nr:hypothetical protein [Candidatus Uhrbacteria bacterium]
MKIAVIAHIYYTDLIEEFINYFQNLPVGTDFHISTTAESEQKVKNDFLNFFDEAHVHVIGVENRGVDIASFVMFYKKIYSQYDLICKVHTKKENRVGFLDGWRLYLLENLLGSKKIVDKIISEFQSDNMLGVIFPEHFYFINNWIDWGNNFNRAHELMRKIGLDISSYEVEFPSGSMFWFRPAALISLNKLNLEPIDFKQANEYAPDGLLEHAIERIFLYLAEVNGFYWKKVLFQPLLKKDYKVQTYSKSILDHLSITNKNILVLTGSLRGYEAELQSTTAELQSTTAEHQSTTAEPVSKTH